MKPESLQILARLTDVIESRRGQEPASSYVASLLAKGPRKARTKVVEEAAEAFEAAGGPDNLELVKESADLLFHLMVLLASRNLTLAEVAAELERREGVGGHVEKAARIGK